MPRCGPSLESRHEVCHHLRVHHRVVMRAVVALDVAAAEKSSRSRHTMQLSLCHSHGCAVQKRVHRHTALSTAAIDGAAAKDHHEAAP